MMEAAKRDSMVHRLSPITKGIYCILMIAIPIITINPFVSLIILAVQWILAFCSNLKDIFIRTMPKLYFTMLLLILIIWPFFYPHGDHVLVDWAFIHITTDGLYFAVAQCLRIAVAITGCMYFVMVTEIIDLSNALGIVLQKVGIGYTAPFMLTTCFKFLPEFLSSFYTIKESFLTRAFQMDKGNFIQKLKNFIPLFIPLIDSSLGKATDIAGALQLRAFGAKKRRTFATVYPFGLGDVLFLVVSFALLGLAIWGEIVHLGGFNLKL